MQNCHGELTGAVQIQDKPGLGLLSRIPALDRQKNYLKLRSSLGYITETLFLRQRKEERKKEKKASSLRTAEVMGRVHTHGFQKWRAVLGGA